MKGNSSQAEGVEAVNAGARTAAARDTLQDELESRATEALASVVPELAGHGYDSHMPSEPLDHAMAYALYGSAFAQAGQASAARRAADWLLEDARKPGGKVGWGLPFEWNAFGADESFERDTIYGITSAFAVRALLDVHQLVGDDRYAAMALEFLDYYVSCLRRTDTGAYFSYSDRLPLQNNVFNVSAMLGGQYARAGRLFGNQRFLDMADAVLAELLQARISSPKGDYWPYGAEIARPNDMVHAAYTVQGIIDMQRWLDVTVDMRRALRYLHKFFRRGVAYEYAFHRELPRKQRLALARLWGLGMLLFTAAESGDRTLQRHAATALRSYRAGPGFYNVAINKNLHYPRHEAHTAFGLARAAWGTPPAKVSIHV